MDVSVLTHIELPVTKSMPTAIRWLASVLLIASFPCHASVSVSIADDQADEKISQPVDASKAAAAAVPSDDASAPGPGRGKPALPAVNPAAAAAAAKIKPRSVKKKEEPEEEWVLLPEAPKKTVEAGGAATGAPSGDGAVSAPATPAAEATSVAQAAAPQNAAEQRLALVIGNSSYKSGRLPNAGNDAHSMSAMLKRLGWQVTELENAGRDELRKTAEDFGNRLAASGGVGLFYYAGHGIQSGNVNYLIPIDADIQDEDELPAHAYESSDLLRRMDHAKNRLNIVILDACRNNPFSNRFASVTKGLASVQPGSETPMIISYATMPGATAADGTGANGLYTAELLQSMSQSGLGIEEVFKTVRAEVKKKSGNKQIPYEANTLTAPFYFNPTAEQAAQGPLLASNDTGPMTAGQVRSLVPPLISRALLDSYQLSMNLPLSAPQAAFGYYADGSSFYTVTTDHRLRIWDMSNGAVLLTQPEFGVPQLSDDGRFVLGQSDVHTIHVLDTSVRGAAVKNYHVAGDIESYGISLDGRRMVVYQKDRGYQLLDTSSSALIGEARKVDGTPHFAFAPAGNRVVLWGAESSDLYFFDTESGKHVGKGSRHKAPTLVRFSQDGSLLLTAADKDPAVVWQVSTGKLLRKLDLESDALPALAEFIDGGKHLIMNVQKTPSKTGDTGYLLGVWDVASGDLSGQFPTTTPIKQLRWSPDKSRLFVTGTDHSTRVFDMTSRAPVSSLNGAELVGFSPDGSRLVAQDGDGIRLYEARSFAPIARLPGQMRAFLGPTGSHVYATAASDGSVRLVDFKSGDPISVLKGHIVPVVAVSFAPNGRQLVTFSDENDAKLWALPNVKQVEQLVKDSFESSTEYQKRVASWSSDYSTVVRLEDYDADSESYAVKIGDASVHVPIPREDARRLAGQREAVLSGKLKIYDAQQLQVADAKLTRVP